MDNFVRMFKQNVVNHAFSRWRANVYGELVNDMNMKRDLLAKTKFN